MYNTTIMNNELLKKIRLLTGLSQVKFAELVGHSAAYVQHTEQGLFNVRPPDAKQYIKIAKKNGLKVTLDDLYG